VDPGLPARKPERPAWTKPEEISFGSGPAEVGEFQQGSAFSQWALARYLVGRALADSMGWALMTTALALGALAALAWWGLHSSALTALLAFVAVAVLLLRALLLGLMRRLTGFRQHGPLEDRMKALVHDTRSDVLRELRRIGLPGRVWTLPLLALRFLGRDRRRDTAARLRRFEVERTVPAARLDELHMLLRSLA